MRSCDTCSVCREPVQPPGRMWWSPWQECRDRVRSHRNEEPQECPAGSTPPNSTAQHEHRVQFIFQLWLKHHLHVITQENTEYAIDLFPKRRLHPSRLWRDKPHACKGKLGGPASFPRTLCPQQSSISVWRWGRTCPTETRERADII